MTMNVGYFLSVLGGTFLGSLAVGRYTALFTHWRRCLMSNMNEEVYVAGKACIVTGM